MCQPLGFVKLLFDFDPLALQRSNSDGKTPFHIACERNNDELVKYLLKSSDLTINKRDKNGMTPLHYACRISWAVKIIEMILHHPDVDVNANDNLSDTSLHKALKFFGHRPDLSVKIVQKLLNHSFVLTNEKIIIVKLHWISSKLV